MAIVVCGYGLKLGSALDIVVVGEGVARKMVNIWDIGN